MVIEITDQIDDQNDDSKCPSSQKHNLTDEILAIDAPISDHVIKKNREQKLSTFLKSFLEAVKIHKLLHERKNAFCGNCEIQEADILEMSQEALDIASLVNRSKVPHKSKLMSNDEIFNSEMTASDYMIRNWPKQKVVAKGRTLPASYETLFSKIKNQKKLKNLETETASFKKPIASKGKFLATDSKHQGYPKRKKTFQD